MSTIWYGVYLRERRASGSVYMSMPVYTNMEHESKYRLSSLKLIKVVFHLLPTQDGAKDESSEHQARKE